MTTELEAILGSGLVTTVFLCGSAVFLIASMVAVTWLTERGAAKQGRRVPHPVVYKMAPRN